MMHSKLAVTSCCVRIKDTPSLCCQHPPPPLVTSSICVFTFTSGRVTQQVADEVQKLRHQADKSCGICRQQGKTAMVGYMHAAMAVNIHVEALISN
ncbi:hypothetical protein HaLaN_24590 [Haematococcus lacustris]|uniref:Uncharacterized protein n=1 Tax=Haematococcus lacustris TaxID=44745 RepID=A0A699ZVE5_HAELA|nr:hypothetical protein HaLaN_24590 [Haematococcus lacustris]